MLICVKCKKEMSCLKNGVGADFGFGHVYPSDSYRCSGCGHVVLQTNPSAIHDPDYKLFTVYEHLKAD
jgi:DNA-directed RNA polymerase subunit RPC12/RpoP